MLILTARGRLSGTRLQLNVLRLDPSIVRFRSLHCKPLEKRSVVVGKLVNRGFCGRKFSHPQLESRAVVISSINTVWPLINKRVSIYMEKTEDRSVEPAISATVECFMKGTQDLKPTYMTNEVSGVNHKDLSVNQSSFSAASFSQEQYSPSSSNNDMKMAQCVSTEMSVSHNKSVLFSDDSRYVNSPDASCSKGGLINRNMKSDLHLRKACVQPKGTDQSPSDSPNLNLPELVNESDGKFNATELGDDETVYIENSWSFLQSGFDEDDSDQVSDGDSLGLDTLFDESHQCTAETLGVTQGKMRTRKRKSNHCKQGLVCDEETFGLENLFDEDLQCRNTTTHGKPQSKLTTRQRNREKRKRKKQSSGLSENDNLDTENTSESHDNSSATPKKKPKKIVPNYFVAIRVSNPHIHSGVKIVQDSIVAQNEKIKPALIPLATLHLTLLVVHLDDDKQIQKAIDILHGCRSSLEPILLNSALRLNFSGLDQFRHQLLFVKVDGEEEIATLKSVADIIRETFAKEGIPSTDSRDFNPHLTVMKLTRSPKLRKKGIRKIPAESYSSWIDLSFGEEPVRALHLCSMNAKDKDGFYKCVTSLRFESDTKQDTEVYSGPGSVPKDNSGSNLENNIQDVTKQQDANATSTLPCSTDSGTVGGKVVDSGSCTIEQKIP